jgi:hypothetical protein
MEMEVSAEFAEILNRVAPPWLIEVQVDPLDETIRRLYRWFLESTYNQLKPQKVDSFLQSKIRRNASNVQAARSFLLQNYKLGHLAPLKLHPTLPAPEDLILCEALGLTPGDPTGE